MRGQYDAGTVGGQTVAAYRAEEQCRARFQCRDLVALRLMIDNWRWAGVPFYLRTGKRLATRSTEIAIRFKRAPYALFRETPVDELDADWLILRVQPDESIRLRFNAKRPGPGHGAGKRGDGFQIQGLVQAGARRGLRDPDL